MKKENIEKINLLKNLLLSSKKTMALTGAGISTNSGIPDFRSKGTGLWEKVDPMEYLTKKVLLKNPNKFYGHIYSRPRLKPEEMPRPNRGHYILAELEKRGLIDGVITQNVDGLHQAAGSKKVYEVHGNNQDGYCMNCGRYISANEIRDKVEGGQIPPRCNYCGGVVRPSVILFGDELPEAFDKAKLKVKESDLLLVVGSSLAVAPINSLTGIAKKFIIINGEKTKRDNQAAMIMKEDTSEALEELMKIL